MAIYFDRDVFVNGGDTGTFKTDGKTYEFTIVDCGSGEIESGDEDFLLVAPTIHSDPFTSVEKLFCKDLDFMMVEIKTSAIAFDKLPKTVACQIYNSRNQEKPLKKNFTFTALLGSKKRNTIFAFAILKK